MSGKRLEEIAQQLECGFAWHTHAVELYAEVLRLKRIEWGLDLTPKALE